MSHRMQLTDSQWFNLICGMIAGLRVKDLSETPVETETILEPINLGGWATIGMAVESVVYEGSEESQVEQTGTLGVFTHDVNIEYSGFTARIKYDSSRVRVTGIEAGLFGDIQYDLSTPNEIYVVGLYGDGQPQAEQPDYLLEPTILFSINYELIDTNITSSTPIEFKFVDAGGYYDTDYSTLLKYVYNNDAWYLYFITPLENVTGGIYKEVPDEQIAIIEQEEEIPAAQDGVYVMSTSACKNENLKKLADAIMACHICCIYNGYTQPEYESVERLPSVYKVKFKLLIRCAWQHLSLMQLNAPSWTRTFPPELAKNNYLYSVAMNWEDGLSSLIEYLQNNVDIKFDTTILDGSEIFLDCVFFNLDNGPVIVPDYLYENDVNGGSTTMGALTFVHDNGDAGDIAYIDVYDVHFEDVNGDDI